MNWIGQHIFDFISRFRNDVHLEKKLYDSTGASGTSGQQLLSTATGVAWTDQTYTHNQSSYGGASTSWTITHNLNKFPSVTVIDTANSVIIGQIEYNSENQLTITFKSATNGKAYLN
tara:strand:- start:1813 stop:2163 length:351 start_codon:yes stop_codon:yes gene_type:complete